MKDRKRRKQEPAWESSFAYHACSLVQVVPAQCQIITAAAAAAVSAGITRHLERRGIKPGFHPTRRKNTPSVDYSTLATFRRSIDGIDFTSSLKSCDTDWVLSYTIGQLCVLLFLSFIFFSLVHSDIVIDVFFLGLVQGYCQCPMVPFSPFPFMFLFVFVFYHVTVWMGSNKLNWTELNLLDLLHVGDDQKVRRNGSSPRILNSPGCSV